MPVQSLFRRLLPVLLTALLCVSQGAQARDLSLEEAERLAVARNHELRSARRAVESARAEQTIAAVRPNPTVSINTASISRNPGIGPGSLTRKTVDTVLRFDQPIERGGKRALRIGAAADAERAARNDMLDVERRQVAATRGAYYELRQAQDRVALLDDTARLFAGTLAAARARLKAGDLAAADVARIEVDAERAATDARTARAETARAALALGFLIGIENPTPALRAADPWPALAPTPPVDPSDLVDARADVRAAQARVEVAEHQRDLARAQRTRDIVVGAQIERYPGSLPTNSVGFGVAVPLFTGNDFSGDIQKAEVERYAALDALERVRAAATVDLERSRSDLEAALERRRRVEGTLLPAAERAAAAAEFAFRRGASSVLEVLDARRTLRAIQLDSLAVRAEHARALVAYRASRTMAPNEDVK